MMLEDMALTVENLVSDITNKVIYIKNQSAVTLHISPVPEGIMACCISRRGSGM